MALDEHMPPTTPPSTFDTGLTSIPDHHIAVECRCGHAALIPVAPARARLGPEARVCDLLDRLRCAQCLGRQIVQVRIVNVGASAVAMAGARQDAKPATRLPHGPNDRKCPPLGPKPHTPLPKKNQPRGLVGYKNRGRRTEAPEQSGKGGLSPQPCAELITQRPKTQTGIRLADHLKIMKPKLVELLLRVTQRNGDWHANRTLRSRHDPAGSDHTGIHRD